MRTASLTICEEQIHYPSEDFPCLCESLQFEEPETTCSACGHAAAMHRTRDDSRHDPVIAIHP